MQKKLKGRLTGLDNMNKTTTLDCSCGAKPNLISRITDNTQVRFRYECPNCKSMTHFMSFNLASAQRDWNRMIAARQGHDLEQCCAICGMPMVVNINGALRAPNFESDEEFDAAIAAGWIREIGFGDWFCPECSKILEFNEQEGK